MSTVWEAIFQLRWWAASILYIAALPAYIILDALANNLNDLRIALVAFDIHQGVSKQDACNARGIDLKDLEEDLFHASQLSRSDVAGAVLTALSIVVGILGLVVICSLKIIGCI